MNESENRKQLQLSVVMIFDIIALLVSCSAASYIRNGQLMQGGRVISGSTTFLYILLVYILVSFFRNTKRDFFKRGFYVIAFCQGKISLKMRVIKRLMDIAGFIVGLLITGLITIFLASVLLLESPRTLIFSQARVGLNGRRFKFYKSRSMYKDAEERKKELMAQNEMNGLMFKMDNDSRITKVGKFIRKTSIDEFSQFWNVLKGRRSIIETTKKKPYFMGFVGA